VTPQIQQLSSRIESMRRSLEQSRTQHATAMQQLAAADAELANLELTVDQAEAAANHWTQQANEACSQIDQILRTEGA
jgi:chromosome segregation ATPase